MAQPSNEWKKKASKTNCWIQVISNIRSIVEVDFIVDTLIYVASLKCSIGTTNNVDKQTNHLTYCFKSYLFFSLSQHLNISCSIALPPTQDIAINESRESKFK